MVVCKCIFLDGKEVDITAEKDAKGSDLFDSICKYLGLKYRDPFGIVFRGGVGPAPYNWWLRMNKTLRGQIPGKCKVWEFAFLVKYYPKTLTGMQEEVARYHVVMQIRQDLLTGRLKCPAQTMAHLCSYWLQAQYGDWTSRHIDLQLADAFRYVQKGEDESNKIEGKSDIVFEEQMIQIHQTHRGMSSRDADFRFIKLASSLPNYGIHYYPAYTIPAQKSPDAPGKKSLPTSSLKGAPANKPERLTIGIGPLGIHQYRKRGNEIVYTWKAMRAVSFKQNRIVLRMQGAVKQTIAVDQQDPEKDKKNQKTIVKEYYLDDMYQTKIIWEAVIEYHMFFRVADQQGLKGEERKRLINSLKFKRTIPMVGEKTAGPSSMSPSSKLTPRSQSLFRFDMPVTQNKNSKRSSSVPPKDGGKQKPRPSSPKPVPHKVQMSRSAQNERERSASLPQNGAETHDTDLEGEMILPTNRSSTSRLSIEHEKRANQSVLSPAFTPMSGTFHFPPKSPYRITSASVASTSGDEVLDAVSVRTDNTDTLCSPSILGKTFSYSEEDGVNKVGYWKEGLTPRGSKKSARELGATMSLQETSRSRNLEPGSADLDSSESRHVDASAIVIPAEILMGDLKESRRMRSHGGGYQSSSSSDFPMELDYMYQSRRSLNSRDAALMLAHDREIARQAAAFPQTGRRAQSMQSLRNSAKDRSPRGRSISPRRGRHTSPLRRRAIENNVPPQPISARAPEKRSYSERAYGESTMPRLENRNQSIQDGTKKFSGPILSSVQSAKRRAPVTVPRRRNVASWSQGDESRRMM